MAEARIIYPQIKLAKLLAEPGAPPVGQLLDRARSQAAKAGPQFEAQMLRLLAQLEVLLTRAKDGMSAGWVDEAFGLASGAVGAGALAGLRGADQALASLCRLMAHCKVNATQDVEGLALHVRVLSDLCRDKFMPQSTVDDLLNSLASHRSAARPTRILD